MDETPPWGVLTKPLSIMENQTHTQSYGVFCVASWMLKYYPDLFNNLDKCWDDASDLYKQFIQSKHNSPLRSELECINNFMDERLIDECNNKHFII